MLAAGVFMNFMLALLILTIAFMTGTTAPTGDVRVFDVRPGSPAAAAGIVPGNIVTHVNIALRVNLMAQNMLIFNNTLDAVNWSISVLHHEDWTGSVVAASAPEPSGMSPAASYAWRKRTASLSKGSAWASR